MYKLKKNKKKIKEPINILLPRTVYENIYKKYGKIFLQNLLFTPYFSYKITS